MLDEARKREKVANAVLGAAMAVTAGQSARDFVKTGHIESPGVAMMQMYSKKRREAERNLDNQAVSQGARNIKLSREKTRDKDKYKKDVKEMKTLGDFYAQLDEMRKEDKVKGKGRTNLFKTLTKKRIEPDETGHLKVKKLERKILDSPAHMGRFKQGMKDPTLPYDVPSRTPGLVRHKHGGPGSGAQAAGIDRGKKKVPGEKKPRNPMTDGPTPAQKVANRRASEAAKDRANRGRRAFGEGFSNWRDSYTPLQIVSFDILTNKDLRESDGFAARKKAQMDAMNDMADEGLKRLTGMKPGDKVRNPVKKKSSAKADAMSDMADAGLKALTGMKPGDKIKKRKKKGFSEEFIAEMSLEQKAERYAERLVNQAKGAARAYDAAKKAAKDVKTTSGSVTIRADIPEEVIAEKCWPGYEKKGMKTMFGKRYPNCVKKKTRKEEVELEEAAFKKQYGKKGKLSQSSKRKSLGRSSTVNPDAKGTGYESPAEFRAAEKRLSPYKEEIVLGEIAPLTPPPPVPSSSSSSGKATLSSFGHGRQYGSSSTNTSRPASRRAPLTPPPPVPKQKVDVGTTADNTKPGVVRLKVENDPKLDKINKDAQQRTKINHPAWWKEKGPKGTAWYGQQQFQRDLTK